MGSDARFFYANDAACRYLGYSLQELLSITVHDIDPNYPEKDWPEAWAELKQQGTWSFETQLRRKDGTTFPVELTANYLEYEGREYNCAFARDITKRKQAETALLEAHEGLEQRVKDRTAELKKINEKTYGKHRINQIQPGSDLNNSLLQVRPFEYRV